MGPLAEHFPRIKNEYLVMLAAAALIAACLLLLPANATGKEPQTAQESGPQKQGSAEATQTATVANAKAAAQEETAEAGAAKYNQAIFLETIPEDELAFLNGLAGEKSGKVAHDKRYRKLMHEMMPKCMFHYGSDMPLSDAMDVVLKDSSEPVEIREGRYVMVSGRSGPYLAGRGFVWMDMKEGIALGGFYFHPTNGEPTPTVTIFSKQVKERTLEMSQLPAAFAEDLRAWSASERVPEVTTRYFISGNNEKILLAHDEDYCAGAGAAAGVGADSACEQTNVEAADIDLDAAYYLDATHYATNGTAWMINGNEQAAWIQVRDTSCLGVADPLGCRIRLTRARTRVIIARRGAPLPPRSR